MSATVTRRERRSQSRFSEASTVERGVVDSVEARGNEQSTSRGEESDPMCL